MNHEAGLDITHGASKLSSRSSSTAYTATSSPSTTSSGTSTTKRKATRWHPSQPQALLWLEKGICGAVRANGEASRT